MDQPGKIWSKWIDPADYLGATWCRMWLLVLGLSLSGSGECWSAEPSHRPRLPGWLKLTRVPQRPPAQATAAAPTPGAARVDVTPDRNDRPHSPQVQTPAPVRTEPVVGTTPPFVETAVNWSREDAPSNRAAVVLNEQVYDSGLPPQPPADRPLPASDGITLDTLIGLADAHHPRLTVAYQRIQAAHGQAVQAGLYPNPTVGVSSPQLAGSESQYNGFVSQEIVTAGKLKLSTAAAQREVSQARFAWQQERFFVVTDLRQKFYATLAAQRRVELLQTLVQIATRSRDSAQKLFDAGEGARGDILLLDIELRRAEVGLKNAETIFRIGKRQIAILVAVPDLDIDSLSGDLEAMTRDYQLDDVRFAAASVNPQANIARLEIDRTAYLLQRACVEPVPNIDIMGGYQRQAGIPAMDQGLFQVTLAIPLWNKNQGNITTAQASLAGARANLQRVELQLAELSADALSTYQTASQLVDQYEHEILPKARETLELSQGLYAQGQIDFLRLLQSQKTLLDAELAKIDAQEQRWVAAAALAGLLQEEAFP